MAHYQGFLLDPNGEWRGFNGDDPDLRDKCTTDEQKEVFNMPFIMVMVDPEYYAPKSTVLMFPNYVNGVLAQSRGKKVEPTCTYCDPRNDEAWQSYLFPQCRRLEGHWGGACGQCIFDGNQDHCSVRDDQHEVTQEDNAQGVDRSAEGGEKQGSNV